MNKLAFVTGVLVLAASPAFAQDTAALGTTPSVVDLNTVVGLCQAVAAEQAAVSGQCYDSTQSYISGLGIGLTDDLISDLVGRLVPLAQIDLECTVVDDEIARAIRYAGSFSTDPDLQARIFEIAQTIADCDVANLGALGPETINASLGAG